MSAPHTGGVVTRRTRTPSETRRLGERIGKMLRAGDVVLLSGELGAGKTVVAQGIGRGLGVTDPIKSSSFVIMNEYDGRELRLFHADLYRLEDPAQVAELALDELASRGVLVVEWPERAEGEMPAEHLRVSLAYDRAKGRVVEVGGRGDRYKDLARRLTPRMNSARDWPPPRHTDEEYARQTRELALLCDAHDGTCEVQPIEYYEARLREPRRTDTSMSDASNVLPVVGATFIDAPLRSDRVFIRVVIHPRVRRPGLGLKSAQFEARQLVDERSPAPTWMRIDRVLRPDTPALPDGVLAAYERHGFEQYYTEFEMHRALRDVSDAPSSVQGMQMVAWTTERDSQIREVYNESFRSRGFAGYDEHEWVDATFSSQDAFRQELSFLAIGRDEIAGFCLCAIDEADAGTGIIDTLGVRPAYRGRGVATALMLRALAAMRDAGFERVALRVNDDNAPARRLYEKLGFEVVKKHVVYRKRL